MRFSISELVKELRLAADEAADPEFDLDASETLESEAADMVEELSGVLQQIADGVDDPKQLAAETLDQKKRFIRELQKRE